VRRGDRFAFFSGPLLKRVAAARSGDKWGEGSEDCLMVNVWRPAGTTARSRLPVMLFIHGGAWVMGDGGSIEGGDNDGELLAIYDGGKLSSAGVIMITINYRLAAFGFMRPADGVGGGNGGLNGVNDMIVALQW
jgi:para-nitrobenzyl esterase